MDSVTISGKKGADEMYGRIPLVDPTIRGWKATIHRWWDPRVECNILVGGFPSYFTLLHCFHWRRMGEATSIGSIII